MSFRILSLTVLAAVSIAATPATSYAQSPAPKESSLGKFFKEKAVKDESKTAVPTTAKPAAKENNLGKFFKDKTAKTEPATPVVAKPIAPNVAPVASPTTEKPNKLGSFFKKTAEPAKSTQGMKDCNPAKSKRCGDACIPLNRQCSMGGAANDNVKNCNPLKSKPCGNACIPLANNCTK